MVIYGFIRRVAIPNIRHDWRCQRREQKRQDKHFFKALKDEGMGFCIFCNAAIATLYALEIGQIKRVKILDWDVHHWNGTQAAVENVPNITFCSIHQSSGYQHTGKSEEYAYKFPKSCNSNWYIVKILNFHNSSHSCATIQLVYLVHLNKNPNMSHLAAM
ncbi:MAG: hypothetical protein V7K53_27535 [Nostoc sp.]|uniref:hypothetical protein n=1 Tax=Nostoc sp. TaxID=1180 RepID=UPI002FFC4F09